VFNTNYEVYRQWLRENISLTELDSPSALRKLTLYLWLGRNYRIITEENTRDKLLITYAWLMDLYNRAHKKYGDKWQQGVLDQLLTLETPSSEEVNLAYWLLGLTRKTAQNLDIPLDQFPEFLQEAISHCNTLFAGQEYATYRDQAWLFLSAGAATLNIRGSQKSFVGKAAEKVFLKASLSLLGLEHGRDFRTALPSDKEVLRETDAEVETKRGRIRIDMGLIAEGNPEVISDKINRVGRNGIVIFDKIGARARVVYETASQSSVKLIQIRHNQPLFELYRHLAPLVKVPLKKPPSAESKLEQKLNNLPDAIFKLS